MAPNQDEHHLVAHYVSCFALVHTERLVLRRVRIEDGPAMFTVHGDPTTNLYNPHGPDPDRATSEAALRVWLQDWEVAKRAGLQRCPELDTEHIVFASGWASIDNV